MESERISLRQVSITSKVERVKDFDYLQWKKTTFFHVL